MTTYTLTQDQLDLLTGVLERAGTTDDSEYKWDTHSKAKKMLCDLQPNTQKPTAWMQTDCIGERFLTFDEPYQPSPLKDKVDPLFTHPAPQQPREPAELLATDDFYSWWEENPSLGQQQALVQFYDKHPAPQAKPLTDEQIFRISENSNVPYKQPYFEVNRFTDVEEMLYRDSSIFSPLKFARAIEAAHGVKP